MPRKLITEITVAKIAAKGSIAKNIFPNTGDKFILHSRKFPVYKTQTAGNNAVANPMKENIVLIFSLCCSFTKIDNTAPVSNIPIAKRKYSITIYIPKIKSNFL